MKKLLSIVAVAAIMTACSETKTETTTMSAADSTRIADSIANAAKMMDTTAMKAMDTTTKMMVDTVKK